MTLPIVVADASIVLQWFHSEGEEAVEGSRSVLKAFIQRRLDLVVLDLTLYEIGNVLIRSIGATAEATAAVLESVTEISLPIALSPSERALAAQLAAEHQLTFYDAAYAAAARARNGRLVTMDRKLLQAGLGVRPSDLVD